jgi:hypothetical protein
MANLLHQVTIPAGGKVQISANLAAGIPPDTYVQQITFQNNGGNNMRLGDVTVSATRGLILGPSGSDTSSCPINYGTFLSDWWLEGTAADVCDILYIK